MPNRLMTSATLLEAVEAGAEASRGSWLMFSTVYVDAHGPMAQTAVHSGKPAGRSGRNPPSSIEAWFDDGRPMSSGIFQTIHFGRLDCTSYNLEWLSRGSLTAASRCHVLEARYMIFDL